MNAEDFMWKRAWCDLYNQYVKIIKVRQDESGVDIYDAQILDGVEQDRVHVFRRFELGEIQWIPYGSSER